MDIVVVKDITLLMNAVGVGNCFLLSFSYLKKGHEPKGLTNPVLSLLFFILGTVILNTILNFAGYNAILYGFEPLTNALIFAIAPLLFLYVRSLVGPKSRNTLWTPHLLHFYCYLGLTFGAILFPNGGFGQWVRSLWESQWMIMLWNGHFIAYLIAIFFTFRNAQKDIPKTAQLIVLGITSIWFLNLLFFLYRLWIHPLPSFIYLNITLFFSGLTVYLFYKKINPEVGERTHPSKGTTRKVMLTGIETHSWVMAIQEQKYYRNPELDIRTLSELLQLPYHELSLAINQKYHQNFNTFINSFRVREVAQALLTQQHESFTIMGLAQQAGFKSPSAFYAAFKKEKGMTPTAFLKRHAEGLPSCSDL